MDSDDSSATRMELHDDDESEKDEYVDINSSPAFQEIIGQFRCSVDQLDVEHITLDLRNAPALKTVLNLLLAGAKQTKNGDDTVVNFLRFVVFDLTRLDDFDIKFQMVVTFQELIPRLYSKKTARLLIELCEQFLLPDDNMIKEEAYRMIAILLDYLDQDEIADMLKLVYKLFENEWNKCTAIDLMAICFRKLPEATQKELRKEFAGLMNDDAILAKSAMARNYSKIIQHYQKEWIESEAIETLQNIVSDIQMSVRVYAVETAVTIASLIEEDLIDKHLSEIFEKLSQDTSWKVRLEVASRIADIQNAVKPKMARMLLLPIIQTLCTDSETIVRKALALNIINVVIQFKETSDIDLTDVFEVINELNKDCNDDVKSSLMKVLMDCVAVLSKEECRIHLLPMMKSTLMCQTITGIQKVPEQCVKNINKLIKALGYEVMQDEIERFMFGVLSAESQWRTRRRLVMTLNILGLNACDEYFTKVCLPFYKKMFNDQCHAVRRVVPMILPMLVGRFGFEWARKNLLSYIFSFHDHPSSSQRLLVLYTIDELVYPSLIHIPYSEHERPAYLNPTMSKDHLYRVFSLNEMLKYKLDQLEVKVTDEVYGSTGSSDLRFYGEDMVDEFAEFEVPSENVMELLLFIIKHIVPILGNYLNDNVINVINRSINTYRLIMVLYNEIRAEFQQGIFRDILETFNKESRSSIESTILLELTEADGHMEEKIEHPVRGKKFNANVRIEDDLDAGSSEDENLTNLNTLTLALAKFGDVNTESDGLDNSETSSLEKVDNRHGSVDNNNANKNGMVASKKVDVNDNGNDVKKHFLDDVDMNLFDQKKTVLEFYSDPNSDAIDI